MDPVDAFAINAMKADWALSPHNFGFDLGAKKIYVNTPETTIEFPLKIIGTVAQSPMGTDTHCWAWDNHPNNFPLDVIYEGPLRERLPQCVFENREELFAVVLRENIDQPGVIYRLFPGDDINPEISQFILFYLDM